MTKKALPLVLLAVLTTFSGCALAHRDPATRGEGSVATELVEGAWMAGEMRGAGTFDADAYRLEVDPSSLTVHTHVEGWAMIRISTTAPEGFDSPIFAPGSTVRLEDGVIGALGCSGPGEYVFEFDGPPEQLELNVEEGPTEGSRLFHFRAVYPDGQHAEGGFVWR
jgi:hypothetical protein